MVQADVVVVSGGFLMVQNGPLLQSLLFLKGLNTPAVYLTNYNKICLFDESVEVTAALDTYFWDVSLSLYPRLQSSCLLRISLFDAEYLSPQVTNEL